MPAAPANHASRDKVKSNRMDAPTRSGLTVPKWECQSNHVTEGSAHHEDYDDWHRFGEKHFCRSHGGAVLKKVLKRNHVTQFFANLPACVIGMEA